MTGKWSGLAPAVNAHLALFNKSRQARQFWEPLRSPIIRTDSRLFNRAITRAMSNDFTRRWIIFSQSYGIPDENGKPILGLAHTVDGAEIIDGQTIAGIEQFRGDEKALYQAGLLAERESLMLSRGVSHYVSSDVMDMVTRVAEMAEPEPIWETDLFCPCGFAVFEKPMIVVDLHPDTGQVDTRLHVWIRAIGWMTHGGIGSLGDNTIGPGVTVFAYTTKEDYRDGNWKDIQAAGLGRSPGIEPEEVSEGLLPVEVIPWRFGKPWTVRPIEDIAWEPGTLPFPVDYQRRWFFAFMRLMWQEIIVRSREDKVDRRLSRRWEHDAKRKELLDYTVLRLRRITDPTKHFETGTGRPLDHRVLVREHWTRQYYPSLGPARLPGGEMNPESHRLILIQQHWRGPEDGPQGPTRAATSFTR